MKKETGRVGAAFQLNVESWKKVRSLIVGRRGTNLPNTAQSIYEEAVEAYLEQHAIELKRAESQKG